MQILSKQWRIKRPIHQSCVEKSEYWSIDLSCSKVIIRGDFLAAALEYHYYCSGVSHAVHWGIPQHFPAQLNNAYNLLSIVENCLALLRII